MASSLFQLTAFARRITSSPLKITRRRMCRVVPNYGEAVENLLTKVSPSIVALKTYVGHLENVPDSFYYPGTGVFVDGKVIVTSAHAIGHPIRSQSYCLVGSTIAITAAGKVLQTRPIAVNFSGDVAVLAAVEEPDLLPRPLPMACLPDGPYPALTVITRHEECEDTGVLQHTPEWLEDRSPNRPEWEHPVDDGFGWARYGAVHVDEVTVVPGSPWFSIIGEVIGVASWATLNERDNSNSGFVVPTKRIEAAVAYGFEKGGTGLGSVVMDPWVKNIEYIDPLMHATESDNVRCGFIATASVLDPPLMLPGSKIETVKIDDDGDGKKITMTASRVFIDP